jgi:hypothetical protein
MTRPWLAKKTVPTHEMRRSEMGRGCMDMAERGQRVCRDVLVCPARRLNEDGTERWKAAPGGMVAKHPSSSGSGPRKVGSAPAP